MWIVVWLLMGVLAGVAWLAMVTPACMRCRRNGRCERQAVCPMAGAGQPQVHPLHWRPRPQPADTAPTLFD